MLKIMILLAAMGSALAQQQQPQVTIVKYDFQPNTGNGEYSFSYELSDGSSRSEQGVLQNAGTPDEFLLVTGSFRWTSPDGQGTQMGYTVDDTGYHPTVMGGGGGGDGGGGGGRGLIEVFPLAFRQRGVNGRVSRPNKLAPRRLKLSDALLQSLTEGSG